ncbi:MAG: hypothetical protein DBP02_15230 [gamma proteobacterium symbiont of Ctena orbiculata]|nr:MAG: hypothetical protein DBP02_15230 [gamma proteobacterium symbiont of Ctena orbiculata]
MNKQDAISLFSGVPGLANAMGTTRQAIYQWPDDLDQAKIDRVIGAAYRLGKLSLEPKKVVGHDS